MKPEAPATILMATTTSMCGEVAGPGLDPRKFAHGEQVHAARECTPISTSSLCNAPDNAGCPAEHAHSLACVTEVPVTDADGQVVVGGHVAHAVDDTMTRLRPACLAWYSAASAALSIDSAVSRPEPNSVTPKLVVTTRPG